MIDKDKNYEHFLKKEGNRVSRRQKQEEPLILQRSLLYIKFTFLKVCLNQIKWRNVPI